MATDEKQIGIAVVARDGASVAMKGLATTAKGAMKSISLTAAVGTKSFKALGIGAALFNQSLELARKGMEMFRKGVIETVQKALEFREENDKARETFKQLERAVEIVRARIGDALIPVLQAVAQALIPVLRSMSDWIVANRKLIGTHLTEFLADTATIAVEVLVPAVKAVAMAWHGWLMIIHIIEGAVKGFMSNVQGYIVDVTDTLSDLAGAVGLDSLEKFLSDAGNKANEAMLKLGEESAAAMAEAEKSSAAIDRIGAAAEQAGQKVQYWIGEVAKNSIASLQSAQVGGDEKTSELQAEQAEQAARMKRLDDFTKKFVASRHKMRMEDIKAGKISSKASTDAHLVQMNNLQETQTQTSSTSAFIQSTAVNLAGQLMAGNEDMGGSMMNMSRQIFQSIFQGMIASMFVTGAVAQANVLASMSIIPITGPAMAIATALMFGGIVMKLISQAIQGSKKIGTGFAMGGLVTGGIPGYDSVPANLMPGERVLNVREAKQWEEVQREGMAAAGGGSTVVNMQMNAYGSRAQQRRHLKQVFDPEYKKVRGG